MYINDHAGPLNTSLDHVGSESGHNPPFGTSVTPADGNDAQEADPWVFLFDALHAHDTSLVQDWKADLDNLLFFACLFSVAVIPFAAEFYRRSYRRPEPEPEPVGTSPTLETVARSLCVVAAQWALDIPADPSPSTTPVSNIPAEPGPSTIPVSKMWLASLVVSLSAAILTIAVKQWLREWTLYPAGTAKERSRFRQMRHRWNVPTIIAVLQVALHLSFVLFYAGLLVHLHKETAGSPSILAPSALALVVLLPAPFAQPQYRPPIASHARALVLRAWMWTEAAVQMVYKLLCRAAHSEIARRAADVPEIQQALRFLPTFSVPWSLAEKGEAAPPGTTKAPRTTSLRDMTSALQRLLASRYVGSGGPTRGIGIAQTSSRDMRKEGPLMGASQELLRSLDRGLLVDASQILTDGAALDAILRPCILSSDIWTAMDCTVAVLAQHADGGDPGALLRLLHDVLRRVLDDCPGDAVLGQFVGWAVRVAERLVRKARFHEGGPRSDAVARLYCELFYTTARVSLSPPLDGEHEGASALMTVLLSQCPEWIVSDEANVTSNSNAKVALAYLRGYTPPTGLGDLWFVAVLLSFANQHRPSPVPRPVLERLQARLDALDHFFTSRPQQAGVVWIALLQSLREFGEKYPPLVGDGLRAKVEMRFAKPPFESPLQTDPIR